MRLWKSAFAEKDQGQLCKKCLKYTRPHQITKIKPDKIHGAHRNGHRSDLCVACIKGKCSVNSETDPASELVASVIGAIGI